MKKPIYITPEFAVSGALSAEDFAQVAAMGFKSILSNLPDGESAAHLTSRQEVALAAQAGLEYRHVPAVKLDLFSERLIETMDSSLRLLPRPVLAHCASGLRSAIAWAAVAARTQPTESVLAKLRAAGLDLEMIRDDLDAIRGQGRSAQPRPMLEMNAA